MTASIAETGGPASEDAKIADLLHWMAERGYPQPDTTNVLVEGDKPAAGIVSTRRDISVVAARAIAKGEWVLSIPPSLHASSHETAMDVLPLDVERILSQAPPSQDTAWVEYVLLAAWLLRQRAAGSASPWQPYIALLPSYVASPATFPDYIVKEFESPEFTQGVDAFVSSIMQMYRLCDREALAGASPPEFIWAILITLSRSFSLSNLPAWRHTHSDTHAHAHNHAEQAEGGGSRGKRAVPFAFLPYADFVNHAVDFNLVLMPSEDSSIGLVAARDIAAGEHLNYSYGLKPNSLLLMNYGFLMEDNPHDSALLAGTVADLASMVLGEGGGLEAGESEDGTRQWLEGVGERAIEAVQRAREAASQSEDWAQWAFSPQFQIEGNEPFAVFGNGAVDPRALAALTAMWHALLYKNEPEYDRVASAATWFGWAVSTSSCSEICSTSGMTREEEASLKRSAHLVSQTLKHMVMAFRTTLEEDQAKLVDIRKCLKWVARNPQKKVVPARLECPSDVKVWGLALETAIKYRIEKKKLLNAVIDRLVYLCIEESVQIDDDEDMHGFSSRFTHGGSDLDDEL